MRYFIITFILIVNVVATKAQYQPTAAQNEQITKMIAAYNRQDFKGMKEPWGILGKLVITPKSLKKQFEPFYKKNGKAKIISTSCSSIYGCTVLLGLEKDTDKRSYFNFIFSNKAKLQGFGAGYPILHYPKSVKETNPLSASEKQQILEETISRYLETEESRKYNGCIIVKNGEDVLYRNCHGYANLEDSIPLNVESKFLLASCSKQFTAAAILILQKESKINIEDPVDKYLTNFPYSNVKIKHLLTHTSGLPYYEPLLKKYWDPAKFASNRDVIQLLHEHKPPLLFQPNSIFQYSNCGYVVLSAIIEQVSGMTYGQFLEENIFKPIGMENTVVVARRKTGLTPDNYALGYLFKNGKYLLPDSVKSSQYVVYQDALTGDDGVSSTVDDQVKWNEALHKGMFGDSLTKEMTKVNCLNEEKCTNYGFGLFVVDDPALEKVVFHSGSWAGYLTMNIYLPEKEISIVLLTNTSNNNFVFLADELTAILLK